MSIKKIVGAIFPLSYNQAIRLLEDKKRIFIKFTRFKQLNKGSRIIFYVSGEKKLIGEGIVANIENLDIETTWTRHSRQLFLTKKEYDKYVKQSPISKTDRQTKYVAVFTLVNLRKYRKPFPTAYPITPSGRYITKEEYERVRNA